MLGMGGLAVAILLPNAIAGLLGALAAGWPVRSHDPAYTIGARKSPGRLNYRG